MNEIISGIAGAMALANQIYRINKASKDAQTKLLISDLQLKLSELQMKIAELNTRHAELMTENLKLTSDAKRADTIPQMEVKDGLYYTLENDGPFCTVCFDRNKALIRLTKIDGMGRLIRGWQCGACKHIVRK